LKRAMLEVSLQLTLQFDQLAVPVVKNFAFVSSVTANDALQ